MEDNFESRNSNNDITGTLMKGAGILAIAGIASKILGAVFRIPLTNMIGAEGQSYYGAAYPVYQFFYMITTAGAPVAIARMVSARVAVKDYINAKKTYVTALRVMTVISLISFALCFFGAHRIAVMMGNPGATISIKAISITLLFAPVVAALRGYFEGYQNMKPTAVSQIGEQIIRVVIGLALSYYFMNKSLEKAAAGATFGASAGMIAALIIMLAIYWKNSKIRHTHLEQSIKVKESHSDRVKELFSIIIPITIGSSVLPIMLVIDSMIIMRRLQATGWSLATSKQLYGLISGFCDPLINLPAVFVDAITVSMIPAVTTAFVLRNRAEIGRSVRAGFKSMMVISFPCAIGLVVLAQPILHLLYHNKMDEADMAVTTLQLLALSIIPMSAMRTLSSCIQGLGKMRLPVITLMIGALVKIICTYIFVGIPSLNINGAAVGSICAYTTTFVLNYLALRKISKVNLNLSVTFIKPMIAALLMGIFAFLIYKLGMMATGINLFATALSILSAMILYFIFVFKTNSVSKEEIALIPKGDKIYDLAVKLKIAK